MTSAMDPVLDAGGAFRCIHDEALDRRAIGTLQTNRGEPRLIGVSVSV